MWRISKLTIIGSDNGLSPHRCQAIIWTNDRLLSIGTIGTNLNEILIAIQTFSFKKMYLNMTSGKCRPSCLGLNALIWARPQCLNMSMSGGGNWILINLMTALNYQDKHNWIPHDLLYKRQHFRMCTIYWHIPETAYLMFKTNGYPCLGQLNLSRGKGNYNRINKQWVLWQNCPCLNGTMLWYIYIYIYIHIYISPCCNERLYNHVIIGD